MDIPKLRAIFELVIEADAADRPALIDAKCAGDVELRNQLEALLRANESAGDFLETPLACLSSLLGDVVPAERAGDVIGLYTLTQKIGEGSFSFVWSAQQKSPVAREVAIKILKPGLDVASIARKFDAEREALARLEHPNISRIYDAGVHASGRPYFVMERVTGVPITDFVAGQKLNPRAIVELMIDVAGAVEYAHRQGLIHRDLKPHNVLVSELAGKSVAKVIDFGIAKLITPDRDSPQTLAIIPAGSPAYMSPEQFSMSAPIDARSDVYAMGVILAELLAGKPLGRHRSPEQIASVIASVPTALIAIVQKATADSPAARYASADEFAADLQRFLDGRKLIARRIRSIKPWLWAATILIGVMLIGFAYWSTSDRVITTSAGARVPTPTTVPVIWRISPPENKGWWATQFDRRSQTILAVGTTRELFVIDANTGAIRDRIRPGDRDVIRCVLSDDLSRVILVSEVRSTNAQFVDVLDAQTLAPLREFSIGPAVYGIAAVDRAANRIAVSLLTDTGGRVDFFDTNTGQRVASGPTWSSRFAPSYIAPVGDDLHVVISTGDGRLQMINAGDGSVARTLARVDPNSAAYRVLDNGLLAVCGEYKVRTIDLATAKLVGNYITPFPTVSATLSADRKSLLVATVDHQLITFDLATADPVSSIHLGGDLKLIEVPLILPDASRAIIQSGDGSMRLVKLKADAK